MLYALLPTLLPFSHLPNTYRGILAPVFKVSGNKHRKGNNNKQQENKKHNRGALNLMGT